MIVSWSDVAVGAVGGLALAGFSARWNWWRPRAAGLPILMYHKVGDPPAGSQLKKLWVSTAQFRRQMNYLKARGYAPITFKEITLLVDAGRPVPSNAVVITFDDGYKNNYINAFPILQEFGFKAVFYIVVQAIGWDNFWHDPKSEARIPMMSWKEVEALHRAGMEIGSHTMTHPRLSRIDAQAAEEELNKSAQVLSETLGETPGAFAYPYGNGQDDAALQKLVERAGYRWATTVHQGKADLAQNPFALNRLFIRGDDLHWDFHLSMTRGRSRL